MRGATRAWNGGRAAAVLALAVLVAACGSGGEGSSTTTSSAPASSTPTSSTTTVAEAAISDEDLCAIVAPLLVARPRPYIGSDEHVAELWALRDVVTGELADDLDAMIDHYTNRVDPADPPSQDFVNFPADVQEIALRVQDELTTLC